MTVLLYPNCNKPNALRCSFAACEVLESLGISVRISREHAGLLKGIKAVFVESGYSELVQECDIILAVGGDGTILRCAKGAGDTPVLGVNSGRLGFMASVEFEELELLKRLKSADYTVQERMMLDILHEDALPEGPVHGTYLALNDVTVHRAYSKICDFEVAADGRAITRTRSDGLVVSTPTGSTAYSLSAGGPILEPEMDCIECTPICPHSIFSRTLVFSPDRIVSVRYCGSGEERWLEGKASDVYFSVDGEEPRFLQKGECLTVKRSQRRLRLIDLKGNTFYNAIHEKLTQTIKGAEL